LIITGKKYKNVGIVGSKLLVYSNREIINSCGHYINNLGNVIDNGYCRVNSKDWDDEREVTSVCGASFAIKREVIKEIGDFDTTYFNYYEDVDFGIRARFAGFNIMLNPKSIVYHKVSVGTKGKRDKALFWNKRNHYIFILKFFPLSVFLKKFKLTILLEYRDIYNHIFRFKNYRMPIIAIKSLICALAKSPSILLNKFKLIKKNQTYDLSDYVSSDYTQPIIPEIHPDYMIFNSDKNSKNLPSRIIFGFNDEILGYGWFNLYTSDEICYRWFGKRAHAYLKVVGNTPKILQLHISAPLSVLKVPKLLVRIDDKKIGESDIFSPKGEWHTIHYSVEIKNKDFVKVTLELDDFVSIQNRGFISDFGCIVNEIALLDENSPLLRDNISNPQENAGLYNDSHLTYQYKIKDFRYDMKLIDKSETIKSRNYFFLKIRLKNTSTDPWLLFNHATRSYVLLGVKLFDKDKKEYPQKSLRFKLKRNFLPGEEDIVTIIVPPFLQEGHHTIRLDMVEEFVCWFEEKGAKPLDIEVEL
jgi:hypothetical protein